MTKGWKEGPVPKPREIIDVIVGMYCMERVGVHHDVKNEVVEFMQTGPPGGKGELSSDPMRFSAGSWGLQTKLMNQYPFPFLDKKLLSPSLPRSIRGTRVFRLGSRDRPSPGSHS